MKFSPSPALIHASLRGLMVLGFWAQLLFHLLRYFFLGQNLLPWLWSEDFFFWLILLSFLRFCLASFFLGRALGFFSLPLSSSGRLARWLGLWDFYVHGSFARLGYALARVLGVLNFLWKHRGSDFLVLGLCWFPRFFLATMLLRDLLGSQGLYYFSYYLPCLLIPWLLRRGIFFLRLLVDAQIRFFFSLGQAGPLAGDPYIWTVQARAMGYADVHLPEIRQLLWTLGFWLVSLQDYGRWQGPWSLCLGFFLSLVYVLLWLGFFAKIFLLA